LSQLKILVQLLYYERPDIVKNALHSLINLQYENWHVAAIDDGSIHSLEKVVSEYVPPHLHNKFTFYNTNESVAQKKAQGGATFGRIMNLSLEDTDADIAVMLCDDDALVSDYFTKLNLFFTENQDKNYAFCWVNHYNPEKEFYDTKDVSFPQDLGTNYRLPVRPHGSLDASQVAWRVKPVVEKKIKFPYPQTKNLDEYFFRQLFENFGDCYPVGCVGQYKGWFGGQLGFRKNMYQT